MHVRVAISHGRPDLADPPDLSDLSAGADSRPRRLDCPIYVLNDSISEKIAAANRKMIYEARFMIYDLPAFSLNRKPQTVMTK
jgi:hypothetical protein